MSLIEQSSQLESRPLFQQGRCKTDDKSLQTQDGCGLERFAPQLIHESRNCSNVHSVADSFGKREALLMEHDAKQRTVNFQPAVIVNKAQLSESIHKKVNSSPGRTHLQHRALLNS
jgi:hypothetical protein